MDQRSMRARVVTETLTLDVAELKAIAKQAADAVRAFDVALRCHELDRLEAEFRSQH